MSTTVLCYAVGLKCRRFEGLDSERLTRQDEKIKCLSKYTAKEKEQVVTRARALIPVWSSVQG